MMNRYLHPKNTLTLLMISRLKCVFHSSRDKLKFLSLLCLPSMPTHLYMYLWRMLAKMFTAKPPLSSHLFRVSTLTTHHEHPFHSQCPWDNVCMIQITYVYINIIWTKTDPRRMNKKEHFFIWLILSTTTM